MLPASGERFSPGMTGNIATEHYHRYCFARRLIDWYDNRTKHENGLDILDIASGEGYGAKMLIDQHSAPRLVLGVDVYKQAISHAEENYAFKDTEGKRFLDYMLGRHEAIPMPDGTFDVVVSFESIEHTQDVPKSLGEIRRVLREDGMLVMSSPNKLEYSVKTNNPNPFHTHEMFGQEFVDQLSAHFKHVAILGQRIVTGSLLIAGEVMKDDVAVCPFGQEAILGQRGTFKLDGNPGAPRFATMMSDPVYYIAVASNNRDNLYTTPGFFPA